MKKIRTIAGHAVLGMLLAFSAVMLPSCDGGADGEVKFATTRIPLPLGRYVQLAHPYATFSISKPDSNGNDEEIVNFDFEILRHVPNIEYLNFNVKPVKRNDGGANFRVKFKNDQDAVEQLSKAIADEKNDRVTVSWSRKYEDMVESEVKTAIEQINGTEVAFDHSTIYIVVPQSKIHISGVNSQSVTVTTPASIHLDFENGKSVYMTLSLESISNLEYAQTVTAKICTAKGDFEATLTGNSNMNGYSDFGYGESNRYYISPKDMDKLLSSTIDIYIDMK